MPLSTHAGKFLVANTVPWPRNFFLSMAVSSSERGTISGLRFLTIPGGRLISCSARLTQGQTTFRSLLSEIEAALASGKTWKQVWQCLADDGLDISYETFRKALQRIRKKARISAPLRGKSLELPGLCAQETADGVARDPLANLKRLEENRPGFHWRATQRLKESE